MEVPPAKRKATDSPYKKESMACYTVVHVNRGESWSELYVRQEDVENIIDLFYRQKIGDKKARTVDITFEEDDDGVVFEFEDLVETVSSSSPIGAEACRLRTLADSVSTDPCHSVLGKAFTSEIYIGI
jgi:hypothetical protein